MEDARDRGRFDWLMEWVGASALASAAGFAALQLVPGGALALALATFVLGYTIMRMVQPETRAHALSQFEVVPLPIVSACDELLLDEVHVEQDEELLLEDALPAPPPDSRVVRLFAVEGVPTAGQLKARIDRHLAAVSRPIIQDVPDASEALFAALADLRRSLR